MIGSIVISKSTALRAKMFFHQRIDNDLLTCGVTSNLPGELADPTRLSVDVTLGSEVVIKILVHLDGRSLQLKWNRRPGKHTVTRLLVVVFDCSSEMGHSPVVDVEPGEGTERARQHEGHDPSCVGVLYMLQLALELAMAPMLHCDEGEAMVV